jgi:hypothetical protein
LGDACPEERHPAHEPVGDAAALPFHLAQPRGALALVLRRLTMLGLRVDATPLERASAEFQNKINEVVNNDQNLSAFIRELKKREFEQ